MWIFLGRIVTIVSWLFIYTKGRRKAADRMRPRGYYPPYTRGR